MGQGGVPEPGSLCVIVVGTVLACLRAGRRVGVRQLLSEVGWYEGQHWKLWRPDGAKRWAGRTQWFTR